MHAENLKLAQKTEQPREIPGVWALAGARPCLGVSGMRKGAFASRG
jgi:hypothetical protein